MWEGECGEEEWVLESLVWAVRAGTAGIPPVLGLCLGVCCRLRELGIPYSTTELGAHLWHGRLFVSITSLWKTQNQCSRLGCLIFIIFKNFKEHLVQHRLKGLFYWPEIVRFIESWKSVYVNTQKSVPVFLTLNWETELIFRLWTITFQPWENLLFMLTKADCICIFLP